MPVYKAPVRDYKFVRDEVFDFPALYQSLPGFEDATPDLVDAIVEESAKFSEGVIAPLYQVGDKGCSWDNGDVKTPEGFKQAYQALVNGGWTSLDGPLEFGGQGLPESLNMIGNEFFGAANWAFAMYSGLSHGAIKTLKAHGTEDQKAMFLEKLVSGQWTGTMCLTEPHCGTDLGMLRTKAEPQTDGSYKISGTKIFISGGDQDLTENIVHIVLARLPDAPQGSKGISLFVVPKNKINENGEVGERNGVNCGSIEHKMGIKGCSTCVMNFDGATGYLVGEPNRGLHCMFTFMNGARLGTAIQGVCHADYAFQNALAYAEDRLQMRSLSGPKSPDKAADPIIVHPDVRRMLLTQKSVAEGGRLFAGYLSRFLDISEHSSDEVERQSSENFLALLTPIAKAFLTELGLESASLGIQCLGGHGFIAEWGLEQNYRDARISTLYEGTTGIQALDLLGRKVMGSGGELLKPFTKEIHKFCQSNVDTDGLSDYITALAVYNKRWGEITGHVGGLAMENPDEIGAAATDYTMFAGYVSLAYMWALAAKTALQALAEDKGDKAFYQAKLRTAKFYFTRLLPRAETHAKLVMSGIDSLLASDCSPFEL